MPLSPNAILDCAAPLADEQGVWKRPTLGDIVRFAKNVERAVLEEKAAEKPPSPSLITKEQSTKLAQAIARYAEAQRSMDYAILHTPGEVSDNAEKAFEIARRDLTEMVMSITEKEQP